jgi:hypothetical protein
MHLVSASARDDDHSTATVGVVVRSEFRRTLEYSI